MDERNYLDDDIVVSEETVKENKFDDNDYAPKGIEIGWGLILGILYLTVLPVLIYYVFALFVSVPNPLIWGQDGPYTILITVAQLVAGAVTIILMYKISKKLFLNTFKSFKKASTYFKALKYAIFAYLAVVGCNVIDMMLFGVAQDNVNQSNVTSLLDMSPIVGCLLTVVCAPIVEELIFRFYVFKGIEKRNPTLAYIITAVAFGGIHLLASVGTPFFVQDLRSLPAYCAAGLVFCHAYRQTKSFAVNVLAHALYNGLATVLIFVLPATNFIEIESIGQNGTSITYQISENKELGVEIDSVSIYLYEEYDPLDKNLEPLASYQSEIGSFTNLTPRTQYIIIIQYTYFDSELQMSYTSKEYIEVVSSVGE